MAMPRPGFHVFRSGKPKATPAQLSPVSCARRGTFSWLIWLLSHPAGLSAGQQIVQINLHGATYRSTNFRMPGMLLANEPQSSLMHCCWLCKGSSRVVHSPWVSALGPALLLCVAAIISIGRDHQSLQAEMLPVLLEARLTHSRDLINIC